MREKNIYNKKELWEGFLEIKKALTFIGFSL